MATSKKALHEALRARYINAVRTYLESQGEEVLTTNSNEIALPCVDDEGNDEFVVVTFKVPTGSRETGEVYDGYSVAEDYAMKVANKAEATQKRAEAKARKIARDKAQREAKAKMKAERIAKTDK